MLGKISESPALVMIFEEVEFIKSMINSILNRNYLPPISNSKQWLIEGISFMFVSLNDKLLALANFNP
jgi:hypothetical protein